LGDLKDNEDFLKGFRWTCCGEQGDAKGCNRGVHKILGVEGDEIGEDDEGDSEEDEDEDDEDDGDEVRVVKVQRLEGQGPSTSTGWAAVSSRGAVLAGNSGLGPNGFIEISDDEEEGDEEDEEIAGDENEDEDDGDDDEDQEEGEGGYDDEDENIRYGLDPEDEESEPEQDHSTLY